MLLIGSDWRPDAGGERLDVLMVATIDPATGQAARGEHPPRHGRHPVRGRRQQRRHARQLASTTSATATLRWPHAASTARRLKRFSKDIGAFLGTEIDYWAMTRFATFANLINSLGGVRVDIEEDGRSTPRTTTTAHAACTSRSRRATGCRAIPDCKPKPSKCRSALVYARSRKGTMGNDLQQRLGARRAAAGHGPGRRQADHRGGGRRHRACWARCSTCATRSTRTSPRRPRPPASSTRWCTGMKLPKTNMKVLAPATWAGLAADGTVQALPRAPSGAGSTRTSTRSRPGARAGLSRRWRRARRGAVPSSRRDRAHR